MLCSPCRKLAKGLLGTRAWLRGVDDELLVGLGVRGERVPVQGDLTDVDSGVDQLAAQSRDFTVTVELAR